jgi:hypothetical protein
LKAYPAFKLRVALRWVDSTSSNSRSLRPLAPINAAVFGRYRPKTVS